MNVIARLEYELAYYDSAFHRFNYYTTRTPPGTKGDNGFGHVLCVRAMVIFQWLYFNLINRCHTKWWVLRLNYFILAVDLWGFVHPATDEVRRWPVTGFIRIFSRALCCFTWLPRFSLWKMYFSFPFLFWYFFFFISFFFFSLFPYFLSLPTVNSLNFNLYKSSVKLI